MGISPDRILFLNSQRLFKLMFFSFFLGNVVWNDPMIAARAMIKLTAPIEGNMGEESGDEEMETDNQQTGELRHEKTGLKIFVIVIPKGGLGGSSPTKPSFGMTLTIIFNL